jgi:PAS domain S-box-containing protein
MAYSQSKGVDLWRSLLLAISFLCVYGIGIVWGANWDTPGSPYPSGGAAQFLTIAPEVPAPSGYVEMPVPVAYTVTLGTAVLMLVTLVLIITNARRRQVEVALREGEERFRTIFEESPIAIQVYDHQGGLIMRNRAAKMLFGLAHEGAEQFGLFDDPNLPAEQVQHLRDDMVVRCTTQYSFDRLKRRDLAPAEVSGMVYLDLLITPLHAGGNGRLVGYLLQAQDVTERVRIEEIKSRAYGQIEKNIEQFAVLGDHIRHPLQVILGMSELIEDERAHRITDEVRKINTIIRDLDNGWLESKKIREYLRRHESSSE